VSSAPPPPPPVPRPKPETTVSYVQLTADNIESTCTGFCIIGFVDTETTDEAKRVKADHQALLDKILESFKKDNKFKFCWVDKNSETSLVQKFSIDPSQPSLVVYNPKRTKFVRSPSFEFTPSFKIIEHVLTGDAKWEQLPHAEL